MLVCHLSLGLATGGLERLLTEFARHHDRRRFEPHFASLTGLGPQAEDIRGAGGVVHTLPDLRGRKIRQLISLARFVRSLAPDVLHTHNAYAHFYGSLAGRLAGVPVVVHTRHGRALSGGWSEVALFRVACHLTGAVVAISDDVRALSIAQGCSPDKCLRIWNGIDTRQFRPSAEAPGAHLISVGRMEPVKDLATLLHACARARERVGLQLVIVGEGSERAALQALATELGLDSCVRFLGERTDVPQLLGQAAVFVNSSLSEGISLGLLEAMSCGLGVIATRVGGNVEVIDDGETGVLVPPGDPVQLADAIVSMLSGREKRRLMGQAARQRVCERFEVQRMVADYERLYLDLARAGTGRVPRL